MISIKWFRGYVLEMRRCLSENEYNMRSQAISLRLQRILSTTSPQVIHSFLPIYPQKEPNILPLLQRLAASTLVCTSILKKKGHALDHVRFLAHATLHKGLWSTSIPQPSQPISLTFLESLGQHMMILVPAVAFDLKGERLGYGKGYYDRLLAQLPLAQSVGISLSPPVDKLPHRKVTDIRVQALVTPFMYYKF